MGAMSPTHRLIVKRSAAAPVPSAAQWGSIHQIAAQAAEGGMAQQALTGLAAKLGIASTLGRTQRAFFRRWKHA
jgi:hypothetical protein